MHGAIRWNGAAKCALDIALHDLVGKAPGQPVHRLLGLSAEIPPTDFTLGHRRPGRRRRASEARRPVPGAQDQGRRPGRSRDARGGPRRVRRPAPGRREHGLGARIGRSAAAGARAARGRARSSSRFPAHRLDQLRWLQERSSLPIVADESAVTIDDLEGLAASWPGSTSSSRNAAASGRRRPDAGAGPGARLPDVPRLHGGDVGRDRGVGVPWRRSPNGSTSTATCCSRTIRSRAWSSTTDCRWRLSDRPGIGSTAGHGLTSGTYRTGVTNARSCG